MAYIHDNKLFVPIETVSIKEISAKLLHIDSSIHQDGSVSRELSRSIVHRFRDSSSDVGVIYHDLAELSIPHLGRRTFHARITPHSNPDPELADDLALGNTLVDEFLQADVVVIGIGFYNFSVLTQPRLGLTASL